VHLQSCVAEMDRDCVYTLVPIYLEQLVADLQENKQHLHPRYPTWLIIDKV
jgi:hypothetical protein